MAVTISRTKRRGISFAGGGFMCVYHTGMGLAMQDYAPHYMNQSSILLYGASAGAVFSVCIACGLSPMYMYRFAKECHELASSLSTWWLGGLGSLHPKYDIFNKMRSVLEEYLPFNAHRLCNGKVNISLTLFPSFKNLIVSDFNTRAELIQAILCSSFVPFYCGLKLPKFRGKYCFDGGFSSNLPHSKDPSIITVSPFTGECDICPPPDNESYYQIYFAAQTMNICWGNVYRGYGALFCLPWSEMEAIQRQGYKDTVHFLMKEGIIPITTKFIPLNLNTRIDLMTTPTKGHINMTTPTQDNDNTSDYETGSQSSLISESDLTTNELL